jgi:hypothetical protein
MRLGKILKVILFVVGLALAFVGTDALAMAVSGSVVVGRSSVYALGSTFLLLAAPCLVLLFSVRVAQVLGLFVLIAFALGALWLAFGAAPPEHPWLFQAASIAFAGLAVFRVGLFLRSKSSAWSPKQTCRAARVRQGDEAHALKTTDITERGTR